MGKVGTGVSCFGTIFYFYWRCSHISTNAKETLINEEIKAKEIRVIGAEGDTLGIMSADAALRIAYDKGLDLVMMAPQAVPPVCKIMDYGKFRFEKEKREKEAKKKQQVIEVKEIQLSYRIDDHDLETKAKQARKFLEAGNKVKVVMKFRGREMSHMTIGKEVIERFAGSCADVGTIDKKPVLDGRYMSMMIVPAQQKPAKSDS